MTYAEDIDRLKQLHAETTPCQVCGPWAKELGRYELENRSDALLNRHKI